VEQVKAIDPTAKPKDVSDLFEGSDSDSKNSDGRDYEIFDSH